jgi:hypothetical protein
MNAFSEHPSAARRTLAASAIATFSVLFAAPALAQPYPQPASASSGVTVISVTGSARDVLDAPPDHGAQEADQCPTDVRLLVGDLLLAGLDAQAANYAVYAIADSCGESID